MSKLNLEGERYGRLLVLKEAPSVITKSRIHRLWECLCDCGNTTIVYASNLRAKKHPTVSCGCFLAEQRSNPSSHGNCCNKKASKEYTAWCGMKQRCFNTKDDQYKNYGGRGITVCDEWKNSFEKFFEDMGRAPSKKHSLDRINVDGNYEPSNCRWATDFIQNTNKQSKTKSKTGIRGVYLEPSGKYRARIWIDNKMITIGYFNTLEEAALARKLVQEERLQKLLKEDDKVKVNK